MTKRANNEGSTGRWWARLTLPNGKRKAFYGKTRNEVSKKLTAALRDVEKGLAIVPERQTVGQFLTRWLEVAKPTIRPATFIRYEEYVRLHTITTLGAIRLARLTPQDLQGLYARNLEGGMSPTSVHHLHAVIHKALNQAVRWGLVGVNVAMAVDPPRRARQDIQPLNAEQCRLFLGEIQGDRMEALYVVALTTGMRLGEILGLHWRDVDLDQGTIQVRIALSQKGGFSEPKTAKGRRQIALPAMAVEALRLHRKKQLEERLSAGPLWEDKGLVFTNAVGSPVDQTNLRVRSFKPLLKKAGLPEIRFHDLRHSAATLLLSMGIHPKVVQELLGHSSIGVTMDVYSHVMPTLQKEAMIGMDRLLRA